MRVLHSPAVVAVAVAVGIGTSACMGSTKAKDTTTTPPPGAPPGLGTYYQQQPAWRDCQGSFQCATVKVPVDYSKPGSGDLKIAMIRLPAKNKSNRIGSLLTNPGGPGGSGIEFLRGSATEFSQSLRNRFDLVGFDPRGVGASEPIQCLSDRQLDKYFATDSSPDDQSEINDLVAEGKQFAGGCKAESERLLPYVGTLNAARDIDVLRAALGDRQLSYLGISYGTYLGAAYADQFPKNVRAMVLDGAVDPKLSIEETNLQQAKGFETALKAFATDCVKQPDCPLGSDVNGALDKVSELLAQTDKTPLNNSLGDGRQVTEALAAAGIASALYLKELWPTLRLALSQAIQSRDGTLLLRLSDALVERKEDGTYSSLMEANMAVNCVDKPYPELAQFEKDAATAKKDAPRFGPFIVWGSLPCAYWSTKVTQEPRALTAAGAKPIVVVGTTRDPATPYSWAQGLSSELESGVLLSLDGDGHSAYLQHNNCITRAVDNYLIDESVPKDGTLCK
ncbi:MAG TPA: alpha/beta hydrolase [Streptosporangiaceae bacterium]